MMTFLRSGATALALMALASSGFAEDDEIVLKKNHHVLHGQVVSSTANSVTFDHRVNGKSVQTHTFEADELAPISFYLVRKHAVEGDAAACLELGQFCLDNGFNARARHLFETAAALDPSMKDKAGASKMKAREASAAALLEKAEALHADGKSYDAWHTLQECIRNYDDTASGQKGKDLVSGYYAAYQDRYVIEDFDGNKAADKELETVKRILHQAAEHNSKALAEKNMSTSLREYDQAAQKYEHALKELEHMAKRSGVDAAHLGKIQSMEAEAKDDSVHAHLNKAGIYLTREAFQDALRETQHALAVDPDNSEAKAYRSRVETVAGLSGGGGILGGRGRR